MSHVCRCLGFLTFIYLFKTLLIGLSGKSIADNLSYTIHRSTYIYTYIPVKMKYLNMEILFISCMTIWSVFQNSVHIICLDTEPAGGGMIQKYFRD